MSEQELAMMYLGRPWVSGARGPLAFDCWGLLWWIYREHCGIELPEYPGLDAADTLAVSRVFARDVSTWEKLDVPRAGCAVAMSANDRFHHVGIWLAADDGLILHSAEGRGVVAESLQSLRRFGINRLAYYVPFSHVHRAIFP